MTLVFIVSFASNSKCNVSSDISVISAYIQIDASMLAWKSYVSNVETVTITRCTTRNTRRKVKAFLILFSGFQQGIFVLGSINIGECKGRKRRCPDSNPPRHAPTRTFLIRHDLIRLDRNYIIRQILITMQSYGLYATCCSIAYILVRILKKKKTPYLMIISEFLWWK